MKITWIVLDDITANIHNNSTHIRVVEVIPYMPNTTICSTVAFVKHCDVIIYQDRFEQHDVYLAEELVKAGKIVLVDISFPIWNPNFTLYNADKRNFFKRLAKLSSAIIVPSDSYKDNIKKYIPDTPIKVIPNRTDFGAQTSRIGHSVLKAFDDFNIEKSAKEYMDIISTILKPSIEVKIKPPAEDIKQDYKYLSKSINFIGNKKKHVHVRDIRDNWIMQIFGDELASLNDRDIKFTISKLQNFDADINYYINWTNNQPCLNELKKTKCDIILFTHFEKEHFVEETRVIKWADLFTCMAKHGAIKLKARGIPNQKIGIIEGIGVSTAIRNKIVIGWAGKPYFSLSRKASDVFMKLADDLDSTIFKFIFYGNKAGVPLLATKMKNCGADVEVLYENYDHFLQSIDYYLSPSTMEGGPMDMLNAFYAGIPVVSRKIGFFYTIKTKDDFAFKDYIELLKFFKIKEKAKKQKFKVIESYNWDNFRKWHINYFKKVLGIK